MSDCTNNVRDDQRYEQSGFGVSAKGEQVIVLMDGKKWFKKFVEVVGTDDNGSATN